MDNNQTKKVIACDLDGTLTKSKAPLETEMADTINKILADHRMAVISGAGYHQFQHQFLSNLPDDPSSMKNLYLFPTNGSSCYEYDETAKDWRQVYSEHLEESEKKEIYNAFGLAIPESGVDVHDPYGKVDILEDRGGQITFSGLGQEAPLEAKQNWDPDEVKRKKIVEILKKYIPKFEIRIGGTTSIDVTKPGINKAYAISKILSHLKVTKEEIVFIGDALFPGGNDETASSTGIKCIQVSGPEETIKVLKTYL